MQQQQQALNSA